MNGRWHFRNTLDWEPEKPDHAPVHPAMGSKATEYEMGEGYESWERPVRVKPKREEVPLTEYEKTGSEKQLKVSPQSVDYIIS